ncbi:MFS transporter [Larkinella soli]|uniref:MFS transporter n=1 Tax=Larkinella soli TaxID=1770527 RepID=UPI000FFBCB3C|nr:MFS transporter [Larkinella soli]
MAVPSPISRNPPAVTSIWTPFQYAMFRAIWTAALVSNIGTWMQNIGGVWLITTLTTSSVLIAAMQTATSLPVFFLSVPAGVLADLLDRQRMLLLTQSAMAMAAIGLGVVTLSGGATALSVLLFTFCLGIGAALNGPAWQSITPEIVPRAVVSSAVTLNGVNLNLARAVGPAIGGLIISRYSPGYVFLLNGVSFIATVLVIYRWKREKVASTLPTERFVSALQAGMRYVRFSPSIHSILVRAFAFTFGASAMWALLSLVIARKLHLGSGEYGSMLGFMGAGAVTGAFTLTRLRRMVSVNKQILVAALVFVGVNTALALMTSLYGLYAVMYVAGIAWLVCLTTFNSSMQLQLPRWVQARVLSIYMLVFQGGMALGSAVWGTLADRVGLETTLLFAAGWMAVNLLLAIPFRIRSTEGLNLAPANNWPEPPIADRIDPEDGPVVIMIEYRVEEEMIPAFLGAMEQLKRLRLRDGASQAGVFSDTTDPERQVEFFTVNSWGEHLRQHARFTEEDRKVEAQVLQFHTGNQRPAVTHFVARRDPVMPPGLENVTDW